MSAARTPEAKSRGLRFAEEQLKRHGWSQGPLSVGQKLLRILLQYKKQEGKGLGKQENGIAEAIKVKVKCDTAGVGHSSAEQFTYHWWDHIFNSSAANIAVETGQDGVQVKRVSGQDRAITNKKPRKAGWDKDLLYGRFRKAATLLPGSEEPASTVASSGSSEDDEDEGLDLSTARRLTDEELVRVCGGRTAHKGARHGLNMSAKLARLEEQERAFLASHIPQKKAGMTEVALNGSSHHKEKKAKKRKRKGEDPDAVDQKPDTVGTEEIHILQEESERPRRKKKKKKGSKETRSE